MTITDMRQLSAFLDRLVAAGRADELRKFISKATEVDMAAAERFIENSMANGRLANVLEIDNAPLIYDNNLANKVYTGILSIESQADDVTNILASLKTIELSGVVTQPAQRLLTFIERKEPIDTVILKAVQKWHKILKIVAGIELLPQALYATAILFFMTDAFFDDEDSRLVTSLSRLVYPPQEKHSDLYIFCAFESSHDARIMALINMMSSKTLQYDQRCNTVVSLILGFEALAESQKNSLNDATYVPDYMEQL